MFTTKQTQLFPTDSQQSATSNSPFIAKGLAKSSEVLSGNGALKYDSTGNSFVDQFAKLGTYKAIRPFDQIERDCEILWAEDELTAVKFMFYLRTINRKTLLLDGTTTEESQKGGELKHEAIMRMIWLSQKNPEYFWNNIGLFVSLGSWHDIFTMLQYDLVYHGWDGRKLNWNNFLEFISNGLKNPKSSELVKKYLPHIKARSACKTVEAQANTIIGKWLAGSLIPSKQAYKDYRKYKSSGTAHQWQQLISQKRFSELNFDKIHGRALNKLVRSKFLTNQNLSEKYAEWLGSNPEKSVKYTGFVHELFGKLPYALSALDKNTQDTINRQFATLIEKGKTEKPQSDNFIVVRDTSTSMGSMASGTTMSCFNIGKALALYFSEFLTGKFANSFIEFNSSAKMHTWKGATPLEKWFNDHTGYVGSTNFMSVIQLFAHIKQEGVAESDFPTGIICISDSEFDPASLGITNVEAAKRALTIAGFSEKFVNNFKIVLWNLQNDFYGKGSGEKFETSSACAPNTFYFSGYSPSVITFLTTGQVTTALDVFNKAMDQEVLNMIHLD